jgi:hypothetical protein
MSTFNASLEQGHIIDRHACSQKRDAGAFDQRSRGRRIMLREAARGSPAVLLELLKERLR